MLKNSRTQYLAHLSILLDDGANPYENDYTRCAAYSRYNLESDWSENDFRPENGELDTKADPYIGGCKPHRTNRRRFYEGPDFCTKQFRSPNYVLKSRVS